MYTCYVTIHSTIPTTGLKVVIEMKNLYVMVHQISYFKLMVITKLCNEIVRVSVEQGADGMRGIMRIKYY